MNNVEEVLAVAGIQNAYTYSEYISMVESVVAEGRTTGPIQSEDLSHYTKLNFSRSLRIYKTTKLADDIVTKVKAINRKQTWYVLTEGWCGDAAQSVPVIALMAEENPLITLKLILRDENLGIMDQFLTDGGRSIPKLIGIDENENVLFTWGPRPQKAQELYNAFKANPTKEYKAFSEDLQRWYIKDKAVSIQEELGELL
tara:strand:- start:1079 stop:1678 length:600 start_codon:yes stop_codon:yes gene_type:complete